MSAHLPLPASGVVLPGCPAPDAPGGPVVPWSALCAALPAVEALHGCPQDPQHHAEGDVGVHTRMVCEALVSLPSWRALAPLEREILFAAAILHDVGKPATTREEGGIVTSPGHARAGALIARRLLWELDVPFAVREHVVGLVRWHMRPAFLLGASDPRRELFRISQTARCDWLAILAEADTRGRIAPDPERALDAVALFREFAAEEGCLDRPFPFPSAHSRVSYFRTTGRDPHYHAYDDTWGEVVVLSGLPGAGKDTWVGRHAAGRPVISLDAINAERGGIPAGERAALGLERAKELLRTETPFIWNSTNLVRDLRAGIIGTCLDYRARVRIVYVEVPAATQRRQNRARDYRQVVPDSYLEARMYAKWDVPDPTEAHVVEYAIAD